MKNVFYFDEFSGITFDSRELVLLGKILIHFTDEQQKEYLSDYEKELFVKIRERI